MAIEQHYNEALFGEYPLQIRIYDVNACVCMCVCVCVCEGVCMHVCVCMCVYCRRCVVSMNYLSLYVYVCMYVVIHRLFRTIFDGLEQRYAKELSTIREQVPFKPF